MYWLCKFMFLNLCFPNIKILISLKSHRFSEHREGNFSGYIDSVHIYKSIAAYDFSAYRGSVPSTSLL